VLEKEGYEDHEVMATWELMNDDDKYSKCSLKRLYVEMLDKKYLNPIIIFTRDEKTCKLYYHWNVFS